MSGAAIHQCTNCGRRGAWDDGWSWYGSYKDQEAQDPIAKFCSEACKAEVPEGELGRILIIMRNDPDYAVNPQSVVRALP